MSHIWRPATFNLLSYKQLNVRLGRVSGLKKKSKYVSKQTLWNKSSKYEDYTIIAYIMFSWYLKCCRSSQHASCKKL